MPALLLLQTAPISPDWIAQLAGQGPLVVALAGFMWWLMQRLKKADESTRELQVAHIEIIKKLGSQIDRNTAALEKCESTQRARSNPGLTPAPTAASGNSGSERAG